jgi:hypothetical protein
MRHNTLPYSIRKHIRREKARIRRQISDTKEAEEKIKEFLAKVAGGLTSSKK